MYALNLHNFEIEDAQKKEIELGIQMMIKIFKNVFDLDVPKNFQIKFQVFENRSDYIKYRGDSTSAVGYYSLRHKEAVIRKRCDCCFIKTVYHESQHVIDKVGFHESFSLLF